MQLHVNFCRLYNLFGRLDSSHHEIKSTGDPIEMGRAIKMFVYKLSIESGSWLKRDPDPVRTTFRRFRIKLNENLHFD